MCRNSVRLVPHAPVSPWVLLGLRAPQGICEPPFIIWSKMSKVEKRPYIELARRQAAAAGAAAGRLHHATPTPAFPEKPAVRPATAAVPTFSPDPSVGAASAAAAVATTGQSVDPRGDLARLAAPDQDAAVDAGVRWAREPRPWAATAPPCLLLPSRQHGCSPSPSPSPSPHDLLGNPPELTPWPPTPTKGAWPGQLESPALHEGGVLSEYEPTLQRPHQGTAPRQEEDSKGTFLFSAEAEDLAAFIWSTTGGSTDAALDCLVDAAFSGGTPERTPKPSPWRRQTGSALPDGLFSTWKGESPQLPTSKGAVSFGSLDQTLAPADELALPPLVTADMASATGAHSHQRAPWRPVPAGVPTGPYAGPPQSWAACLEASFDTACYSDAFQLGDLDEEELLAELASIMSC
jgi:hypothetical protein